MKFKQNTSAELLTVRNVGQATSCSDVFFKSTSKKIIHSNRNKLGTFIEIRPRHTLCYTIYIFIYNELNNS